MKRWRDRVLLGGVLFLLVATPLAFGSVHPWAFSLLEIIIFLLLILWVVGLNRTREEPQFAVPLRPVLMPAVLFAGLVLVQLCPLPPAVLRSVSSGTYALYSHVLPGWPQTIAYNKFSVSPSPSEGSPEWSVLPTPGEVTSPATVQRPSSARTRESFAPDTHPVLIHSWRPLSLAPQLTGVAALKLFSYIALFALIVGYAGSRAGLGRPREAEARFLRAVMLTILFSGSLVAIVGIIQAFSWNGKILWFFVPYDWHGMQLDTPMRAQGPFVNYSHFANYLTVIFPLALTTTVSPTTLVTAPFAPAVRLLWGGCSFLIGVAILLSNSRGGWIGLLIGSGVVLWGISSQQTSRTPTTAPRLPLSLSSTHLGILSLAFGLVIALAYVGAAARTQMDARLEEALQGEVSGVTRVALWSDTSAMIRDFPVWGVGLGSWSTLFPRYQRPALTGVYFREAHNDYIELLAETGIIGIGLAGWFFVAVANRFRRGLVAASPEVRPLLVACGGALGVMATHETMDFNLQIPANAILFTVVLAITVRLAYGEEQERQGVIILPVRTPSTTLAPRGVGRRWAWQHAARVGVVSSGASVLIILAMNQESVPYPYHLQTPRSVSAARASLHTYPTHAPFHLAFARLVPPHADVALRQSALQVALWLEPGNARARDLYAATLFRQGKKKEGLEQTSLSVFYTPETKAHVYLNPRLLPWLPADEHVAIEQGLRRALADRRAAASSTLGQFYASLGRFRDQAIIYEEAAHEEKRAREKVAWLLQASGAYRRAHEEQKVEQILRAVIALAPQEPQAYQQLIAHVLETTQQIDVAKAVVDEGVARGVQPFGLWVAFADAAQGGGYLQEAKEALARALTIRPESLDAHVRLGHLYLQEQNFARAAVVWRKVTELDPTAASAFFHLGIAERGRYRFFEAEKAFTQALALQPNDLNFQREHAALRALMEKRTS